MKLHIKNFRLILIRQLLETHFTLKNEITTVSCPDSGDLNPVCLLGYHFIRCPHYKRLTQEEVLQKPCTVYKQTKRSRHKKKDTSYVFPLPARCPCSSILISKTSKSFKFKQDLIFKCILYFLIILNSFIQEKKFLL